MAKELLQARFPATDAKAVEEYAEDHDISRSDAIRRLVRLGLDAEDGEEEEDSPTKGFLERLASAKIALSSAVYLITGMLILLFAPPVAAWAYIGVILITLGIVTIYLSALANLALARPLTALLGRETDPEVPQ
jgi:hypothetical protein